MINFLLQHQFWVAVGLYWIFSAAISAMPEPKADGSPGYLWLYRFLHTTAGNLTTAFSEAARYRAGASRGNRIPGIKPFILLLLAPIVFSTTACAAHYRIHPGAVNATDSAAYDALLIAEAEISKARMDYQAGQITSDARNRLDNLIRLYNVARESWLTYRGAVATNNPPDQYFQQLNQNLTDLLNAIRAFEGKGVRQ
jgi:hypothetical protein